MPASILGSCCLPLCRRQTLIFLFQIRVLFVYDNCRVMSGSTFLSAEANFHMGLSMVLTNMMQHVTKCSPNLLYKVKILFDWIYISKPLSNNYSLFDKQNIIISLVKSFTTYLTSQIMNLKQIYAFTRRISNTNSLESWTVHKGRWFLRDYFFNQTPIFD